MSGISQIIKCIQGTVREGDNIVFSSGQDKTQLGKVIHSDEDRVLSIDCSEEIPHEVLLKHNAPCSADGIDFVYSEQNCYLTYTVRFTKVTVNTAEDARKRITTADVSYSPESGVYVSVWFKYNH
jgi:hypothetical protein